MDFSLFLTIVAAAIGLFVICRKFRSHQENKELDSSSLSTSSPPSSLSISSVPPSSSSHNWTNDVFPSFCGEDVRRDFLSHIQREFKRKGITPVNDNGIKRGESIGPELISAIRGSKITIILLSTNYPSSKWCLEELVEIMKCREELGQTVMAVFYKVNPSDVKTLTGDFGKVFRKTCVGKTRADVEKWREALEKVATIAGYHSSNWEHEAVMIEKIAMDVSNKLFNYAPSSDFDGLVGMRAHMKMMEPFLLLGSDEVRLIGIWGPSGIGKSTIARVLFSKYSSQFQLSVFMDDIKRRHPRLGYNEFSMKLKLQNEFLAKIINQEDIKIHHLGVVQDRLKDKRVLAVLDDVDHLVHLDAMAKEPCWFGSGSRIIITTQDRKLLYAHGINHIYEVEFPPDDEALQIFCMNAFGQKSPCDGFENLSFEVTRLAGNLPLGLSVMGSYFKGMSKQDWEDELPRLRTRLDGEIESILKFSYDALCNEDQALFLHIACFFNGEWIEKVEEYLSTSFVGVKGRLRVLAEKSFISFDSGYIMMHDLLERLGREIVRKQSPDEPGQRQFLVDAGDICQVLRNDTLGSRSVIGINLKVFDMGKELKMSDRAFERMSNVQFLRLSYDTYVLESLSSLPQKVRLLHWRYFPMTSLPSNSNTEFLVEINMPFSNLEKLWEGNNIIRNLKWMDLRCSSNLKELPDLSTATNLQELNLSFCSSLAELPFSIWDAVNLRKLDLRYCSKLVKLPSFFGNVIIKLQELNLRGCTSLMQLPSSMENAANLEKLDLEGCLHLHNFPSSTGNLRQWYLRDCSSLVELPSSARNAINLKDCTFSGCLSLVELPSYLGNATCLKEFDLSGCSSLQKVTSSIGNMTNLQQLYLNGCSSLVEFPFSIGNMTNLVKLNLEGCSSLVELPSSIGNMTYLMKLNLDGCSSLVELPSSIGYLHNLEKLHLKGCSKLKILPININMKSLDILDLTDCSSLKSFPEISTNIRFLELIGTAIQEIPTSIRSWSRLEGLDMSYSEKLRTSQHAFDRITELHLIDKGIQEIAPWVKDMSRLKTLVIKGCKKLVSLPQLPESLAILDAEHCESLERIDCSFYKTKLTELNFANCFKLNQEVRDHIIKTSTKGWAVFPGDKVPTYFTFRATGSSLAMKLTGFDTNFSSPLRFKACFLLVNKGDVKAGDWKFANPILYCIKDKLDSPNIGFDRYPIFNLVDIKLYPPLKEHLFLFEFETTVNSAELVFKLEFSNKKWEIEECGLRPL